MSSPRHGWKLTRLAVVAGLLTACVARQGRAQTTITLQPGKSVTVKAAPAPAPIHDTITKLVVRVDTVYVIVAPPKPPSDTAPTPPIVLPPDSTPPSGTHEPVGAIKVSERGFNALVEDGWTNEWYKPAQYAIVDSIGPRSPGKVAQMKYPANWADGSAPADLYRSLPAGCSTLYTSLWFKYSTTYYGNHSNVNKIWFFVIGGQPAIVPEAFGSGMGPLRSYIVVQNTGSNGNYGPNLAPNDSISRGVWHRLETVTTGSTLDWWLDGKAQGHVAGKNFGGTVYSQARLSPNYGGFQENAVPHDQYLWVDHAYLSCKP